MATKKPVGLRVEREEERAIAFRICDLFFREDRTNVDAIAKQVSEEFHRKITREQIYPTVTAARSEGMVELVPPLATTLQKKVAEKFDFSEATIHVENVRGSWGGEYIAAAGAELVTNLVREVWDSKPKRSRDAVRIGLGPGRAALDFSRAFSQMLQSKLDLPPIELIAITAGCPARTPQFAPASFFNLFPRKSERVSCVGFFGEVLVRANALTEILKRPGVKEAYGLRDQIDIVTTSMGDPRDEHDLLKIFFKETNEELPPSCRGNVQYRPYSSDGPILETGNGLRPLTVFELSDFREMAKTRDRHVVLLARQCSLCSRTRASALGPLLTSPELKVWSHLVMDASTASELTLNGGSS